MCNIAGYVGTKQAAPILIDMILNNYILSDKSREIEEMEDEVEDINEYEKGFSCIGSCSTLRLCVCYGCDRGSRYLT